MKDFLSPDQVTALRLAHRSIKDKKLADRIKAILYLHYGFSYEETAKLLLLDGVTLRRYVGRYKEAGIDGLLECRYHGGKSRLTTLEQESLEQHLVSHTLTTAKQVQEYIQKTYGKSILCLELPNSCIA